MGGTSKIDIDQTILDPKGAFGSPAAVLEADGLTREEKLRILRQWELDARELLVATEENMGNGDDPALDEIVNAIAALSDGSEPGRSGPTKHGLCTSKSG